MIDIRIALRNLLVNDPAVAALAGTRVYPGQLPQGIRTPSVVYNRITGRVEYRLNGSAGLIEDSYQIDSIAVDHDTATALALAVHDCLSARSGSFVIATVTYVVRAIFRVNTRDLYDSTTQLHRIATDFTVWYRET